MHPLITMMIAWVFVVIWISFVIFTQRKHHPKALFYLFFVELWERFSYYGMRALLVLYMTKSLMYSDEKAGGIYGAYVALVYATPVLGGYLAEKLLGARMAIMIGAIFMAIGHFAMAFEYDLIFFAALGFLIVGNGFFKPNISTMVGKFYAEGDPKRDSAFTLFYMGINTGAFLTPLTCGTIGEIYGWHYGFGIAGIGMLLGLVIFYLGNRNKVYLEYGLPPVKEKLHSDFFVGIKLKQIVYVLALFSVPIFALLVNQNQTSKYLLYVSGISMLLYLLFVALKEEKVQREKLFVVLILFLFTTMFWTFFELAGSAITLFTDRNVNKTIESIGLEVKTSQFQGVNPFFIILLAPLFSILWEKFKNLSIPFKFSIALIQLGLGFFILVIGSKFANTAGMVPLLFLVFAYLLHTTGELCLSPIGLSLVTKLSPVKIVAVVMGIWLLSSSFAGLIGAEITKITSLPSENGVQPDPTQSLLVYTNVFEYIAYISIGTGIGLFFLIPILNKWMHGIK
ncbi:MAG TPA: oligopeptide:H+ symporter [Cytophagaceae bacterium]|jgi:POT family proton-dependent oligopeptide transporter|nr:oligopeptide:H+ symporter [Cytophagaceae bacterium]